MLIGNVCKKHPELAGRRHNGGNCPECLKASKAAYRERNREKIRCDMADYRAANPARLKEMNAKWRANNAAQVKALNLRRTGFTLGLLDQALAEQNGLCAICGTPFSALPKRHMHADHCHLSGAPRGVLCHACNTALGQFGDSPERLQRAIEYLADPPLWRHK